MPFNGREKQFFHVIFMFLCNLVTVSTLKCKSLCFSGTLNVTVIALESE